jgi:uncharacterized protein
MACKSKLTKILVILLLCAWPALAPAVTPPLPAHPSQYVVDLAGVLDAPTQARLNGLLHDLEAKTAAQVVVLTINSLERQPIEEFSHHTAVLWGIGQKGKDNGVLLTVAVKDHKYRIEVGYGLEGTLPDSLVGSLGRQYLVPNFRRGDYAGGITATVNQIAKIVSGGKVGGQAFAGKPQYHGETVAKKQPSEAGSTVILLSLFLILVVISIFMRAIRGGRGGGGFFWLGGGPGGGGWSSEGGGFGGFSGGGGDFGGGGASGDW